MCKGPEVRTCLVHLRNGKETGVAGQECMRRTVGGGQAKAEECEVRLCWALLAIVRNVAVMLRQEPLQGF